MIPIADMHQELHKLEQEFNKVTDTDNVSTALCWAHHALKFTEGIVRNIEHDMSEALTYEENRKLGEAAKLLREINSVIFDMQQERMRGGKS